MAIKVQGDVVIYDSKVFRPARLTTTERNALGSPQSGMLIYNTSTNAFDAYNGVSWVALEGALVDEYARTVAFLSL
jgi:hypothetical protein